MPNHILCPSCASRLPFQSEAGGLQITCSKCGHAFRADTSGVQPTTGWETSVGIPGGREPADQGVVRREDCREPPKRTVDHEFVGGVETGTERDYGRRLDIRRHGLIHVAAATPTIILIAIVVAIELVDIGVSAVYVNALSHALRNPDAADFRPIELLETVRSAIGIAHFGGFIAASVLFLVWVYGAYANLSVLGARQLRFSPGWAVGYFFVPFLNLVRPYQVVQEMWKASDPGYFSDDPYAWQQAPGSVLASFWWPLWLISNVVSNISFRFGFEPNPTDEKLRTAAILDIAAAVSSILPGILVIFLIQAIKKRQQAKDGRLADGYLV